MGYFAARSAPLGRVAPEVVAAVFHNFAFERVARALPAAWEFAGPETALRARLDSAAAALRRYGITDGDDVVLAAELAGIAARHADLDGRPLFAANRALPWPDDPVAALWHAATLLREHRGDAHVAALTAAGISGREANVLHVAAGRVSRDFIMRSRDYDESTFQRHERSMAARGLLDDAGALTPQGRQLKEDVETTTDRLALGALAALDDDDVERLFQTMTPLTRLAVAGGDVPAITPMALSRRDLNDDSANLG